MTAALGNNSTHLGVLAYVSFIIHLIITKMTITILETSVTTLNGAPCLNLHMEDGLLTEDRDNVYHGEAKYIVEEWMNQKSERLMYEASQPEQSSFDIPIEDLLFRRFVRATRHQNQKHS